MNSIVLFWNFQQKMYDCKWIRYSGTISKSNDYDDDDWKEK